MIRVLVVGGGMAGVSIGYELAARAEVLLAEQEPRLAYHTTGRSAAMYLQSYGNRVVRALTVASAGDFDELRERFQTVPLLIPKPLLWTADAEARPHLDQMLAADSPLRAVDPEAAIARCPVLRRDHLELAAEDTSAMDIDVDAMHGAYVRGMRERGAVIRPAAEVTALARDGGGWSAAAGGERLGFDVVVDAAGAWADVVAERAGVAPIGLRPLRRTIFVSPVAVDPAAPPDSWPFIGDAGERFYFKGEHDQVMVSPADEAPDVPRDARPEPIDIARTIELVNQHTSLGLRSVRTAWAGLRSFAADRSPVAGTRTGEDGFFWFAGQGGYGIQMAPALARSGAALVLDGRLPPDVTGRGISPADLSPDRLEAPRPALP